MATVQSITEFLQRLAPVRLAAEWDNVGLLVGRRGLDVSRLMTCLTITPATAAEAIEEGAQLIVTHHPLPFHPVARLTDDTTVGRLILDLVAAGVGVYSAHTAFDSAQLGINERLAAGLGLRGIAPLIIHPEGEGTGRYGWLAEPQSLSSLAGRLKAFLSIERLQIVGEPGQSVRTVAVACGAADELLDAARQTSCDAMLLGEARFHTCLAAESAGISLLLPGHYASERFAMNCLATVLAEEFPDTEVWASRRERDPLQWG